MLGPGYVISRDVRTVIIVYASSVYVGLAPMISIQMATTYSLAVVNEKFLQVSVAETCREAYRKSCDPIDVLQA